MSILAVALVLAAQQAAPPAERRPITEMDLFRFVWIGDPQISPDGSDVDDCAAWHAIRYGTLDGECERKPLVDHCDVACGGGFAVGDRRRSHQHLHSCVHRTRVQGCDEQRKQGGSRDNVIHARTIMA